MAVGGVPLYSRAAQSLAVCSTQYAWLDNSKRFSPCQVAASVDALCNSGNWILPALNASVKYNPPNTPSGTASLCTCSWASYNLLSACTACQGFPEQIPQWSFYSFGCGGFLTDVAFPSNITLPESVSIPFWAGEDPSNWPGETFNVNNAQQIASQGHADLTGNLRTSTPVTPQKSNNTGEILAITFAGILAIALALVSYLFYRRRKLNRRQATELPQAIPNLKVMRLSAMRTISSPYRSFFAPPPYNESTTHFNPSTYPARPDFTETQSSIHTNHSRMKNSYGDHEMSDTWGFHNPSPLIGMPQPAVQGWNDKKPRAVDHRRHQLRVVS
ncbi:hypothetical protein M413DRAFT_29611 [Hebeloma cylindrosporum]|uniref:Uncharacterized protein n=1 Tax=Hebeloma cylindrosporum TaxID=76867 RepID=A0A0C2XMY0_HEBCY|nr:hypothetical protein M413DRAFT_29611 [Hebeloma cylindrosporum h7]